MTEFSLIPRIRLRRLARQSSDKGARHKKESHDLQYGLAERTSALGCGEGHITRLDLTAGTVESTRREGPDCVCSSLALEDAVIGWKASRLSCRNKEWRRRFDICRMLGTVPVYPFHPFHTSILGITVKPKRRDVVVSTADPNTRDLQFPLRIPLPDSAQTKIAELAPLRRKASMGPTPLPITLLDVDGKTRDNLPQTVLDACNGGGDRAATTTSEPNPNGRVARTYRPNDSSRTGRSHGPHSGGGFSGGRRKTQ